MRKIFILLLVTAAIVLLSIGSGSAVAGKFSKEACAWAMFPAYGTPPYQSLCVDWDGPVLPYNL